MPRARVADGLLNLALAGAGLVVLALLYGLAARTFVPRADPVRDENPAALDGDLIQVEVLNAAGVSGIAAEATRFLRRRGFDVVVQGNHRGSPVAETVVIDRVESPEAARRVAVALGLPAARIRTEVDLSRRVDASVVLGPDYTALVPFDE